MQTHPIDRAEERSGRAWPPQHCGVSARAVGGCGQVGGKVAMDLTMPAVLAWVLGGNADKLSFEDRAPHCRIPDKPKTFHESVSRQCIRCFRMLCG